MKFLTSIPIQENISLAEKTSWLVGGPAEFYYEPQSIDELRECLFWARNNKLDITILSGGSNVLISDQGISGLVIGLQKLKQINSEIKENRLIIRAQAGVRKTEVLKIFLKYKLDPALFLAGLPGDVGAGVVMNAGVSENMIPREFCEIVESFNVMKTDAKNFPINLYFKKDIEWGYRHSSGWQPGIITEVTMSWPMNINEKILEEVRLANKNRFLKQPLEFPSCGSVFVNPTNLKVAKLIDDCGLKGFTIGGAQVSLKHANFIVNINQAKAQDIHKIIEQVKKIVFEKTGIAIKTEVIYLGRW